MSKQLDYPGKFPVWASRIRHYPKLSHKHLFVAFYLSDSFHQHLNKAVACSNVTCN